MSTPFTAWMLIVGGVLVVCGWLMLLVMIARALQRRPARGRPGRRVHTSRPTGRGRVVAAPLAARVATTLLMPAVSGRHRTGSVAPLRGRSVDPRLRDAARAVPGRAVAAPCWGWGAATLTLPGRAMPRASDAQVAGLERGRVYVTAGRSQ